MICRSGNGHFRGTSVSRIPLFPSFVHLRCQQVNDLVFIIFGSHKHHLMMSTDYFILFVHLPILI